MTTTTEAPKASLLQVQALCRLLIERVDALKLKGKKADSEALAFVVGAMSGARIGHDEALASHLQAIVFLVSIRGMFEVRRIASSLEG